MILVLGKSKKKADAGSSNNLCCNPLHNVEHTRRRIRLIRHLPCTKFRGFPWAMPISGSSFFHMPPWSERIWLTLRAYACLWKTLNCIKRLHHILPCFTKELAFQFISRYFKCGGVVRPCRWMWRLYPGARQRSRETPLKCPNERHDLKDTSQQSIIY